MAKPPPDLADAIGGCRRASRNRGSHLLHVTLLKLIDLADRRPEFVPALLRVMQDFEAPAFMICFDRIHEHRCVTLRGSEPVRGARAFQKALKRFLGMRGVPVGGAPDPHLTISYAQDGLGREEIDPISWRVEELLLIESLVGAATHVVHGRWSLQT